MQPRAFRSTSELRAWLEANHASTKELLVRCFKTSTRDRGLTYRQALDEALCFGWIDGVRRAVDDETFSVRFTPRKPTSYWSAVNIRRATELREEGRLHPSGLAAFEARHIKKPERYSFENQPKRLGPTLEKRFRSVKQAWTFFRAQAPWYQRTSIFWVMEARREETRRRRLEELIASSAQGEPIRLLARGKSKGGTSPESSS